MQVKELIQLLKEFKPELNVVFETEDGDEIDDFIADEAYGNVVIKKF